VYNAGNAEVKRHPFLWYHYFLNKVNLHPHWCENLKSCKGDTLPVHAMKAYGEEEKVLLYALLIIALDGVVQSVSCPTPFITPSKEHVICMEQEAGWALEPVRTCGRRISCS
jgi:hypothetical protein